MVENNKQQKEEKNITKRKDVEKVKENEVVQKKVDRKAKMENKRIQSQGFQEWEKKLN